MKPVCGVLAVFGVALAVTAGAASAQQASGGGTLAAVRARGILHCGVHTSLAGFMAPDDQGRWTGLNVDICHAIATAVLGDGKPDEHKVKFLPLSTQQRFSALQSGEVDVLAVNATWSLTRDTALGFNFAPVTFFDGQGFMVSKKSGVKSARELAGATVCVPPGTTTELNVADYFRTHKMSFEPVVIQERVEMEAAFFSGRCDAFTSDVSALASTRAARAGNIDDYIILPERISREPLAPAYRQGDDEWGNVVDWVIYALIQAEESGITQSNVDEQAKSDNPEIKRLLGTTPGMGKALNLDEKWALNAIRAVGNYGEMFERHVGRNTPLRLERGQNDLWFRGGLMYAMPFR